MISPMGSLRARVYSSLQRSLLGPWLLPRWMSESRIDQARNHRVDQTEFPKPTPRQPRAWFHASSVGELESLIPLIEAWLDRGQDAVVTVFSESAKSSLDRLLRDSSNRRGRILFGGYAPWEGSWGSAIDRSAVSLFISAKYEAWPELWGSLGDRQVPLFIVGARARNSLRAGLAICAALGMKLPRISLLAVRSAEVQALRELFGSRGEVEIVGDPRWDRVCDRAKRGSARATELKELTRALPRPWGVLGQVWPEDLEVWRGSFVRAAATLWVVPHRVDREHIAQIEAHLGRAGLRWVRTSDLRVAPDAGTFLLVDELGVLSELYSSADWAYVGGGFGVGIHSTIEPALSGLPIACGPQGTTMFSEVAELQETGQLRVLQDSRELGTWLDQLGDLEEGRSRSVWTLQAKARLGSTARILSILDQIRPTHLDETAQSD